MSSFDFSSLKFELARLVRSKRIPKRKPNESRYRNICLKPVFSNKHIWRGFIKDADLIRFGKRVAAAMFHQRQQDTNFIPGRSFFVGFSAMHFGHFLTESICRLAALSPEDIKNFDHFIVLSEHEGLPPFANDVFRFFGISEKIKLISQEVALEDLLVTEAPIMLNGRVFRDITNLSRFCTCDVKPSGTVFLSRTKLPLNGYSRAVVGEELIENALKQSGVRIVYPETEPLQKQIEEIARSQKVIGFAGSALHTMLLAGGNKQVFAYSARVPPTIFGQIDKCLNNKSVYVNGSRSLPGMLNLRIGFKPQLLNVPYIIRKLKEHGFVHEIKTIHSVASEYENYALRQYNTAVIVRYLVERHAENTLEEAKPVIDKLIGANDIDLAHIKSLSENLPWMATALPGRISNLDQINPSPMYDP